MSSNHSAFVIVGGYVLTMGDNKEGQLGLGHTKDAANEPSIVKKITDKFVTVILQPSNDCLKFKLFYELDLF